MPLIASAIAQTIRVHKAGHQLKEICKKVDVIEHSVRSWVRPFRGGMPTVNPCPVKSKNTSSRTLLVVEKELSLQQTHTCLIHKLQECCEHVLAMS